MILEMIKLKLDRGY